MRVGLIFQGDKTTTGGVVLVASGTLRSINNVPCAVIGDLASCMSGQPLCTGSGTIVAMSNTSNRPSSYGKPVAISGDKVECGCSMCFVQANSSYLGLRSA